MFIIRMLNLFNVARVSRISFTGSTIFRSHSICAPSGVLDICGAPDQYFDPSVEFMKQEPPIMPASRHADAPSGDIAAPVLQAFRRDVTGFVNRHDFTFLPSAMRADYTLITSGHEISGRDGPYSCLLYTSRCV